MFLLSRSPQRDNEGVMSPIRRAAMFMKNLTMLGGALLISHFGAGPLSFDAFIDAQAIGRRVRLDHAVTVPTKS
jgi:uncharacterized membrane protein YphA (DoxX/SURF4 family)